MCFNMYYIQLLFTSIKKICQVCTSVPVPQVREVKEIECQKCRKYKVPVPKTRWVKECNPVYDEKCKTEYHQHCKEETRCHQLYQTICDNSGYQQVRMLGGFKLKNVYSRASLNFANLKCTANMYSFSLCLTFHCNLTVRIQFTFNCLIQSNVDVTVKNCKSVLKII